MLPPWSSRQKVEYGPVVPQVVLTGSQGEGGDIPFQPIDHPRIWTQALPGERQRAPGQVHYRYRMVSQIQQIICQG